MLYYVTHDRQLVNRLGQTVVFELLQELAYAPQAVRSLPFVEGDDADEIEFRCSNELGEGVVSYTFRPYFFSSFDSDLYNRFTSQSVRGAMLIIRVGTTEIFRGFPDFTTLEKDRFNNEDVFSIVFVDGLTLARKARYDVVINKLVGGVSNPYHQIGVTNRLPVIDLLATYCYGDFTLNTGDVFVLQRFAPRVGLTAYDLIARYFVNPNAWSRDTAIEEVVTSLLLAFGWRMGYSHQLGRLAIIEQRPAQLPAATTSWAGADYDENLSGLRSSSGRSIDVFDATLAMVIERVDGREMRFQSESIAPVGSATYREATPADVQLNTTASGAYFDKVARELPFENATTGSNAKGSEVLTSTSPDVYVVTTFWNHPDINYPVTGWLSSVFASASATDPDDEPYFSSWRFTKRLRVKVSLLTPSIFDPMQPIRMKLLGLDNPPLFQPAAGRINLADVAVYDLEAVEVRNYSVAPGTITGLNMWLKSDSGVTAPGGLVETWLDSSGNGVDAIQVSPSNRPTLATNALESFPAIIFDSSSSSYLDIDSLSIAPGAKTIFIVFQAEQSAGKSLLCLGTNSGRYDVRTHPSTNVTGAGIRRASHKQQGWRVLAVVCPGTICGEETLYMNGKVLPIEQTTARGYTQTNGGTIGAATILSSVTNYLDGAIAEILVYDNALSSSNIVSLSESLMQKYRIGL